MHLGPRDVARLALAASGIRRHRLPIEWWRERQLQDALPLVVLDSDMNALRNPGQLQLFFASIVLALFHGLPHLLGSAQRFPMPIERALWLAATGVVLGTIIFVGSAQLLERAWIRWIGHSKLLLWASVATVLPCGFLYTLSSAFLLVESFRQLLALPEAAFKVPH